MPAYRKATAVEVSAYAAIRPRPLYPLAGYLKVGGVWCAVEFPGEGPGEPNYEAMAPAGQHFAEAGPGWGCNANLHSLLGTTLADLKHRADGMRLESCDPR